MKKNRFIIVLLCVFIAVMAFSCVAQADVGNSFSGGTSGGGFSGGSSGGSFGGSYGGSGLGSFLFFSSGSTFEMILFIIILMFIAYARSKGGIANYNGGTYQGGANTRVCNEANALAKIKMVDPNFSEEKFKGFASDVWLTLQEAWEKKNWKTVRPLESNELFNTHNRQIQEYIDRNRTDHMDMQNIRSITIADYKEDGEHEILVVKLYASLLNYVTDDNTGRIVEGSDTQYVHRNYYLEFIRSKGVKTEYDSTISTTNCPNCGAPTSVTASGECEYCHSVITNGNYGWVLNEYQAW